jgi:hypothetical protein
MKISHLLNPFCGGPDDFRSSKSPTPACYPVTTVDVPRRQKIPKDAPIFSEGNRTVGNVNFPYNSIADFKSTPLGKSSGRVYGTFHTIATRRLSTKKLGARRSRVSLI